jgi:hypothetical protein
MTSLDKQVQRFRVEKEIAFIEAIAGLQMGHTSFHTEKMKTLMYILQAIRDHSGCQFVMNSFVNVKTEDHRPEHYRHVDKERVILIKQYLKEEAEFWEGE